ncbi:MAG: hypothetical protein WA633_08335 [Stellaceae bacterium]
MISISAALATPSGSAPQRQEIPALQLRGVGGFAGLFLEDVERGVDDDRTRSPGDHRLPRLSDGLRHLLTARRLKHLLAHGPHGGWIVGLVLPVEFLEGAAVELHRRHVAGDRKERHRIEIRVGKRNRQIDRARAARGESRIRLTADPVIDVRHEARHGVMPGRDRLDLLPPFVERVDKADIAVAAETESVGHLLADQVIDDHLPSVQHLVAASH